MRRLRILVVEDDVMIGPLLAETLEDLGHTVCAVELNGVNAVAAAARLQPDLVIVDIGLGEEIGIAVVTDIVGGGFAHHVFVMGDVVQDLSLGPSVVQIKRPFRATDVAAAIHREIIGASGRVADALL